MNRPVKNLDSSFPIVFDGLEAVVWVVFLHNPVRQVSVKNITPGVLYSIVVQQDEKGGYNFVWPSDAINAPPINTTPYGCTSANFIGTAAGALTSNTAATWVQP